MKLKQLSIQNYKCFGNDGVNVLIDDIVLLIGVNDAGKSTVLDAYEDFASMGAALSEDKFCSQRGDEPVRISAMFSDVTEEDEAVLGANWTHEVDGSPSVQVRWVWASPGQKGQKQSFNPDVEDWVDNGMGGWDSLIQSRIPTPLRIGPLSNPLDYEAVIRDILVATVKTRIKAGNNEAVELLGKIQEMSSDFKDHVVEDINRACAEVTGKISGVFPGYGIGFEPSAGKFEPEKIIGAGSYITISSPDNAITKILGRGTGVQRSFLWSALSALADLGHIKKNKKKVSPEHPRILLVDEPESFLHPPAIRRARDSLYGIAAVEGWQVMCTTHSPVFVDVSKPHTTIVRVASAGPDEVKVFQTDKADFSDDERESLRMVRVCDPTVCEFFFAETVVVVEGETEHLAIGNLLSRHADDVVDQYAILNARGKGNIVLFMKILNQFGLKYIVIHDADAPKARRRDGSYMVNGMWTVNANILEEHNSRNPNLPTSYLFAQVPDFENQTFGYSVSSDKPDHLLKQLGREDYNDAPELEGLRNLCGYVTEENHPGRYSTADEFRELYLNWFGAQGEGVLSDPQLWELGDQEDE